MKRIWEVLFLGAVLALPAAAQEGTLAELERVTAVDVFVELGPAADAPGEAPVLPRGLGTDDLEVELDGERVPVVAYSDPRQDGFADREPWSIVVYFDQGLASTETVRWGAAELAARVDELAALGEIEVVLGGEESVRRLGGTRDAGLIENQLSGIVIDPIGVHATVEQRAEALAVLEELGEEPGPEGLMEAVVDAEAAAVEARLDELVIYLTSREVGGSKRALIWVTDGFDLDPADFYRQSVPNRVVEGRSLEASVREAAQVLAAYGWTVLAVSPPPPDAGLVPGWRIGKWLFSPGVPRGLIGGTLTREERRDPDKAESFVELGETHLSKEEPQSAREAFEKALYHYAGDPRTAKRQARARAGLGRAFEALGRNQDARQAFLHAAELDPDLEGVDEGIVPRLLDPVPAIDLFTGTTAGRTIRDEPEVDEALASLERRARVTYQRAGAPVGRIQRVKIAVRGRSGGYNHPLWSRSGTPETVAAARARHLAAGGVLEGELAATARLERPAEGGPGVRVALLDLASLATEAEGSEEGMRRLRLSVAFGPPEAKLAVRHEIAEVVAAVEPDEWSYLIPIESWTEDDSVAVVVEDLETGRWGAVLVE